MAAAPRSPSNGRQIPREDCEISREGHCQRHAPPWQRRRGGRGPGGDTGENRGGHSRNRAGRRRRGLCEGTGGPGNRAIRGEPGEFGEDGADKPGESRCARPRLPHLRALRCDRGCPHSCGPPAQLPQPAVPAAPPVPEPPRSSRSPPRPLLSPRCSRPSAPPIPVSPPPVSPPPPRRAGPCGLRAGTGPAQYRTGTGTGTDTGISPQPGPWRLRQRSPPEAAGEPGPERAVRPVTLLVTRPVARRDHAGGGQRGILQPGPAPRAWQGAAGPGAPRRDPHPRAGPGDPPSPRGGAGGHPHPQRRPAAGHRAPTAPEQRVFVGGALRPAGPDRADGYVGPGAGRGLRRLRRGERGRRDARRAAAAGGAEGRVPALALLDPRAGAGPGQEAPE